MADKSALTALLGYAIGTAQIVVLEWFRKRALHGRQLRLLRSETRRALHTTQRYNLRLDKPPDSDHIPRPPSLSARYVDTVTAVDFSLTDEHSTDNTQESLLGIVDGIEILQGYRRHVDEIIAANREEKDKAMILKRTRDLFDYAQEYDRQLDHVEYQLRDTLREIARRLRELGLPKQLWRMVRPLRPGTNPPPLERNDPRLKGLPALRAEQQS